MDDEAFLEELRQLVASRATAMHLVDTLAFVEEVAERLVEDPVFGEFERVEYAGTASRNRPMRLHGETTRDDSDGTIGLVIGKWSDSASPEILPAREVEQLTACLTNFVSEAASGTLQERIVESNPAYDLARTLANPDAVISRIRLHVISNQYLSQRFKEQTVLEVRGIPVERHIWDLRRLKDVYLSSREREAVEIRFPEFGVAGIPCLPATGDGDTKSYVCTVPGSLLADVFEKYGSRILEGNVRAFLGLKGNVNKGIRATIQDTPELFFAYNNGIAATASALDVELVKGERRITRAVDLQVVNGGQTTAAILSARKKDRLSLDGVTVPMKLTVVQADDAHELIPRIAQYANTQNKIDIADFFSNHPFHRKMADISVRLRVPAKPGVRVQSKWFYERSRGQYQNERLYLSKSKKEQRDLEFPPSQVINKTDLAKYDSTWREKPYWACLGVQKNIRNFAKQFESTSADMSESENWNRISPNYGDAYYERSVAMAILWKATEKLVSAARDDWYQGDYRAQIVAYALAMFLKSFRDGGGDFDTGKVWLKQEADPALLSYIEALAKTAQSIITAPADGGTNFGEWAKKEACWQQCLKQVGSIPPSVRQWRLEREDVGLVRKTERKTGKIDDGIACQKRVLELAANGYWAALYGWDQLSGIATEPDRRLLSRVTTVQGCMRVAIEKDWRKLLEIAEECESEGFRHH